MKLNFSNLVGVAFFFASSVSAQEGDQLEVVKPQNCTSLLDEEIPEELRRCTVVLQLGTESDPAYVEIDLHTESSLPTRVFVDVQRPEPTRETRVAPERLRPEPTRETRTPEQLRPEPTRETRTPERLRPEPTRETRTPELSVPNSKSLYKNQRKISE